MCIRDSPFAGGRVGLQNAGLGRRVAVRGENEPRAAPRPADGRVEALILLLVYEDVGTLRLETAVAVDAIRTLGGILDRVEKRHVVRRPHGARRLLDALGPEGVRAQVLDEERVLPKARVVRRVREKVPVVAHGIPSERHELLALRELVQVEGCLLYTSDAADD